ncbi:hypothetical protein Ae201684P_010038 [Aphanomyces euteiches]|uniref:Uncharacterized protein n=1 Tax=Aphanomyces euteiches TaxID=100861 RepID=A0A6G0WZY3_9STRA|nr:hypothetical protein Ae201684_009901 [Aphanomyces euteiches]KAH9095827.1 hypothetical protein Ae201684P_010038 [Aphanomyces euteiches]
MTMTACPRTFSAFLGPEVTQTFMALPHADKIRRFEAFIKFVQAQRIRFRPSKRATTCHAVVVDEEVMPRSEAESLVAGRTISGFGVDGTADGFLPQCELSLGAAWLAHDIGHQDVVENPRGSFKFGWCHAEKQKLTELRRKMTDKSHWRAVCLVVDRNMCSDCIAFTSALAAFEDEPIRIRDPEYSRVFQPQGAIVEVVSSDGALKMREESQV